MKFSGLLLLAGLFPLTAFSQDQSPSEWKANVGVSGLINTGNSSNQSVGGNALTSYKRGKNKFEFSGNGAYGRAKIITPTGPVTQTNVKNWKIQERYDRYLTDVISLFGFGHSGQDKPAGFYSRYGAAAGFAHELYKTDPHFFKYETGADWTHESRVAAADDDIYSGRLFLQYKLKISDWATFGQDVETLVSVEDANDTRFNTLTALTMKLTDKVSFQAGYGMRIDLQPVPGFKKVDTTTQIGLVVNFI